MASEASTSQNQPLSTSEKGLPYQLDYSKPGLRKLRPYWYAYTTMAKGRWFDREILEVISTEFRDRSVEYYRYALESGVTTVNSKVAKPGTIVRNGDQIQNMVHRHEPPVTSSPVKIILHDKERQFVAVNKPGSIPVHAAGRYFKNSLVEILKNEFGFPKVYTVNRLDRLTSGLMIIALSPERARVLTDEFFARSIGKEYIARVKGEFPEEEIKCSEPLLTIDRQMGLNIVHPEGKPAETIFKRMHYDPETHTSVIHCRPLTGRSHQLRVHLQYLGYPIANDPVYSDTKIWGKKCGKGGIDLVPSEERAPPAPPLQHQASDAEGRWHNTSTSLDADESNSTLILDQSGSSPSTVEAQTPHSSAPSTQTPSGTRPPKVSKSLTNPAWRTHAESRALMPDKSGPGSDANPSEVKLLPRETGHDIGMGSPVPLSLEAVGVITRLRNQKDEEEDWSRWRDVIFRAKKALSPSGSSLEDENGNKMEDAGLSSHLAANGTGANDMPSPATSPLEETSRSRSQIQHLGATIPNVEGKGTPPGPRTTSGGGGSTAPVDHISESDAHGCVKPNSSSSEPIAHDDSITTQASEQRLHQVLEKEHDAQDATETRKTASLFCPECYLPLHPDPKPEKLYIFLHALRYTTSLGSFETEMPEWAAKGWKWDQ